MNRQERRAAKKAMPAWKRRSKEEKMAALVKNGITPKDMKEEGDRCYMEGYMRGVNFATKTCYAAAILAAHEAFGFGKERCQRLLKALDEQVLYSISDEESMDKVFRDIGVKIEFSEGVERVQEV